MLDDRWKEREMTTSPITPRANLEPAAVFAEAMAAATKAKLDFFLNGGREAPFNCGFAWVTVKPARGAFVDWCMKQSDYAYGSKAYGDGWQFWGPGNWPTAEEAGVEKVYWQDMDVNAAGARAFAEVLRENGLDAYVGTRMD